MSNCPPRTPADARASRQLWAQLEADPDTREVVFGWKLDEGTGAVYGHVGRLGSLALVVAFAPDLFLVELSDGIVFTPTLSGAHAAFEGAHRGW